MPRIEIIIRDNNGEIVNQITRTEYELKLGQGRLSDIEGVVDKLKNELLPALEADLLHYQQQQEVTELKKTAVHQVQRAQSGDN